MPPLHHIDKTPETETEWFAALAALTRFLRSPEAAPGTASRRR
jgi:hypothetical protein